MANKYKTNGFSIRLIEIKEALSMSKAVGLILFFLLIIEIVLNVIASQHDIISDIIKGEIVGRVEKIAGRRNVINKAEFPYMAALENKQNSAQICGAVIIRDDVALTAAHCTENYWASNLQVSAGSLRRSDVKSDNIQKQSVLKFLIHPEHRKGATHNFDICIIWLSGKFMLNKYVNTVKLSADSHVGETATILGWGRDENLDPQKYLQKAELSVISRSRCTPYFNSYDNFKITHSMLCAISISKDRGPCKGDSGGPLVIHDWRKSAHSLLVGIASWMLTETVETKVRATTVTYVTCSTKTPSVFTDIAALRKWILSKIN